MRRRFELFEPRDPQADAMGVFLPALLLTALGIVCVYSFGAQHVLRQGAWAVLGIAACLAVSRLDRRALVRAAHPLAWVTGGLLVFALLFAPVVENTRRWIVVPHVGSFQPSELAKLAVILLLAARLAPRRAVERGVFALTWPVLALAVLVVFAPDLGTTVFLAATALALLLIAGARVGRLLAIGVAALPVLAFVIARYPYMQRRLEFFEGKLNYQQVQALLALGNGGFWGRGLGAGRQKLDYLPAGHTDFVLPNIGEELGFLGVLVVGVLFGFILVHGLRVALAAERRDDRFGFLLACGATFVVVFQAVLNIAVATGAAPTKGISLPFLSQGGSNLLISLVAIGLVVHVARTREAAG